MSSSPDPGNGWIDGHLAESGGFPRADWDAIGARIEGTVPRDRWGEAWDAAARHWLRRTAEAAGPDVRVLESRNFLLMAPRLDGDEDRLLRFLEHSLRTLLVRLEGIASDEGLGRHAVLILGSRKLYYDYVDWFYPPGGSYPFTGGLYLGAGYGHFALPWKDLADAEATVAHELTHACLGHLPIPPWLNEGMAVVMERIMTDAPRRLLTKEEIRDLRSCWDEVSIQSFWSGASFHSPDDGFELGYMLGYHMVKELSRDFGKFREFVLRARADDAGESALRETIGGSLGSVAGMILGPGDWRPRPGSWDGTSPA